jgi:1-acyl-sn-glycerol-3-phosphate acyltransferase
MKKRRTKTKRSTQQGSKSQANWTQSWAFEWARKAILGTIARYLRIDFAKFRHIPKTGAAVVIANHSGFSGLDALMLAYLIHRETGRSPRILAHHAFFDWSRVVRSLCFSLQLREPHVSTAVQTLKHGHILIVFPEGETGNFKSSRLRYRLQPFHSGFLRLALEAQVPILPFIIIGAEETNLNLGNIDLGRWFPHLRIPLPVNFFPLPVKWKIMGLSPIPMNKRTLERPLARETARIQDLLQNALDLEIQKRSSIFF